MFRGGPKLGVRVNNDSLGDVTIRLVLPTKPLPRTPIGFCVRCQLWLLEEIGKPSLSASRPPS